MIQVDKQGLPTFIWDIHVCNVISQISSHEVKCEDKWYEVWNMKRFKIWKWIHLGVSKKDPSLLFHFHVLNFCKYWSNVGLTKIQMSIKFSKKSKKWKTCAHCLIIYNRCVGNLFGWFRQDWKKTCLEMRPFTLPLELFLSTFWHDLLKTYTNIIQT